MTNGFREFTGGGGQPTPEKPIGHKGGAPALSGLVGQPKRALCAKDKKSKEKEKKGGGGKGGGLPPTKPSPTRFGGGRVLPLGSADPLRVLGPQGKAPLPPTYIYGGFRADLRRLFHGSPTTYLHGFPLDRVSAELGRSPAETRSSPTSGAPSRCRRTLLPLRLSCWIKKAEIIVELYVC